jgi:MFS family permease
MNKTLTTIVISQFFCTSLWFAGNAIMPEIIANLHLENSFLAHVTSAIQFGFITGTLTFAVLTIADRFSPSLVFWVSAVLAGIFNLAISLKEINLVNILIFRFLTGFFLAGIYPVGMKIASDYYQKGLGKSLGFLVGAVVLGTAFPYLLRNFIVNFSYQYVIYGTSILSLLGGIIMYVFVPDGPYRRVGQKPQFNTFFTVFKNKKFQSAAFGYFGHMWELYAFWAFIPVMLKFYKNQFPDIDLNIPLYSFLIIASGSIACVLGGQFSERFKPENIATFALAASGVCCLVSPFFLSQNSVIVLLIFLFFWGMVVVADSPLFSTLVAQNAPEASRGTSLTIVNCIGFAITIVSIQFINVIASHVEAQYLYTFLAIGPVLGLMGLLQID